MRLEVMFGVAKIGLIATLAYGNIDAARRIDDLEARVRDLAGRVEAAAGEGRDLLAAGEVELADVAADGEGQDAEGARAVVLDDEDGEPAPGAVADDKPCARSAALSEAVDDLVADAKGGDGGEEKRKRFMDVHAE